MFYGKILQIEQMFDIMAHISENMGGMLYETDTFV